MSVTFEKDQIVSATDLIRAFPRYVEKELPAHDLFIFKRNMPEAVLVSYARYEKLIEELRQLQELVEQKSIYATVKKRVGSKEKALHLNEAKVKYGL
jgi:hypothetical protein